MVAFRVHQTHKKKERKKKKLISPLKSLKPNTMTYNFMLPNITQRQQPNLKDQNILRTQNQLHWNLHRKASPSVESPTRSRHQRSGRTEVSDSPWWQCAGWATGTRASSDIRNVAHFDLALNGAHRESTTVNRRCPSPASSPPSSASPSRRASRAGPPSSRLLRRLPVGFDSLHRCLLSAPPPWPPPLRSASYRGG